MLSGCYNAKLITSSTMLSLATHALFLIVCWQFPAPQAIEVFMPESHLTRAISLSTPIKSPEPIERVVIASFDTPAAVMDTPPEEPAPSAPALDHPAELQPEAEKIDRPAPTRRAKRTKPARAKKKRAREQEAPKLEPTPPKEASAVIAAKADDAPPTTQPRPRSAPDGDARGGEPPTDGAVAEANARGSMEGSDTTPTSAEGVAARTSSSAGSSSSVNIKQLRGDYMRALVPRLDKSYYYPAMAKRLGLEDRVLVAIWVDARGEIIDIKVHKSRGHAILDEAAVDALRRLDRLPEPPAQLVESGSLKIIVPMRYSLSRS